MIRQYTLVNFILRSLSELKYPQTKFVRNFKDFFFSNYNTNIDKNTLEINVLYDLNFESPTFDFAFAMLQVDKFAKKNNIMFRVIIIKRKRKDYKNWFPLSVSQLNNRIKSMLIPLSESFDNCLEAIFFEDIKDIKKFNDGIFFSYNFSNKISYFNYKYLFKYLNKCEDYDGIKIKKNIIEEIKLKLKTIDNSTDLNRVITITLRSYNYEKERDSDIEFWLKIAEYYKKLNYKVYIIPDTDNINDESHRQKLSQFAFLEECALIMNYRIAIYEIAKVNFFPHSGTAAASQLNKNSASVTHLKTHDHMPNLSKKFFNDIGQTVGENYKFLCKNHKIYWNGDTNGIIEEANKIIGIKG